MSPFSYILGFVVVIIVLYFIYYYFMESQYVLSKFKLYKGKKPECYSACAIPNGNEIKVKNLGSCANLCDFNLMCPSFGYEKDKKLCTLQVHDRYPPAFLDDDKFDFYIKKKINK